MNVVKKIINVFGILIALVLCLVLTAALITTPVLSATTSFMQTETLKKVVKNIDYKELLAQYDMEGSLEDSGLSAELIDSLVQTGLVEEVVEVYVDSVFAVLEGDADDVVLSAETVNDILQKYLDDIVPIVKEMIGDEYPIPEEMIRSLTSDMLKEYSGEIADMLPGKSDLGLEEEVLMAITLLRDGTIFWAMVAVVGILSLLILLCRFMRFKGFMWLGVVYLICGAITLMAAVSMGDAARMVMVNTEPGTEAIITPIISILSAKMLKGGGIVAGLAVLFIIIFVVGRKIRKKRIEQMEAETMYQEDVPNGWV